MRLVLDDFETSLINAIIDIIELMSPLKQPISHSFNLAHSARCADFGGWQMPTFYSTIIQEHKACREHIGLFDVSHMGRWWVTGTQAQEFLNYLTTNDLRILAEGRSLYAAMLNDDGGIIDDLIIYKINTEKFLLVNNAGNHNIDSAWYYKQSPKFEVKLEDITPRWGQIAIQGPDAKAATEKLLGLESSLKYFNFREIVYQEQDLIIAATGYTGEQGYELYGPPSLLMEIWMQLIDREKSMPCGLGSRDLLRLEAGYCLHGNDIDTETTPYEAGLDWVTKLEDHDFIGKAHVARKNKKLVGLAFPEGEKLIPRAHTIVTNQAGETIGEVTSGNFSHMLDRAIALAYIHPDYKQEFVEIEIRGKKALALVGEPWFYRNIRGKMKHF